MRVDYSELAARYCAMTAEEFESISREDLAGEAKSYYDQEMARRVPGWRYEEPTPEMKFLNLTKLQKRVRRRFVIHVACWIVLLVCLGVFYFLVPPDRREVRAFIEGILLIVSLTGFVVAQSSARQTGYLILWLRRFHRRQQKPFQHILNQACRFVGMPITIQDSSLRYSQEFAISRLAPLIVALLLIVFLGAFLNRILLDVLMIFVFLSMSVMAMMYRYLGFLKFPQADQHRRLLKLLEGIREGKVRNAGVLVLRCEDTLWRSAVEMALRHADAIVVDVTEPSENVIWELQTALAAMSPERILLACAKDASAPFPVELPGSVQSELQPITITVPLSRFPTFFYPRANSRFGEMTSAKSFRVSDLRDALVKCLTHAPAHDGPGVV